MALVYQTPGVYYERADSRGPAIGPLRTDIAGFVGVASRGPVDVPVPIESWRQFEANFGGFSGPGLLPYAVRGFFENGGRRCWVVRVASKDASGGCRESSALVLDELGEPAWRVRASSPGVWGNNLRIRVTESRAVQTVTLPGGKPEYSRVQSVAGFARGMQVRISQQGGVPPAYRVISEADALQGRLWWVHPKPEMRLPYDRPLTLGDPDLPFLIEGVDYTVSVRFGPTVLMVRTGLSLIRENDAYGPRVLPPLESPLDLKPNQLPASPLPVVIEELREQTPDLARLAGGDWVKLSGGQDGLTLLRPYDFIGEPGAPEDSDEARAVKERGIEKLAAISEVAIVAVPDVHIRPVDVRQTAPPVCVPDPCLGPGMPPPFMEDISWEQPPVFRDTEIHQVQAAMVSSCERLKDRIAVLDVPYATATDARLGVPAALDWRSRFDSKYAALYYPWVEVVDPLRGVSSLTRAVPPCGHVAGQYAKSDMTVGVHKAPANQPVGWVQNVTAAPDDEVHGLLNSRGINLIKLSPARRIRIMGARTVSSDPDWRFVNVRRLLMKLEKAIGLALSWAAFEPNNVLTRTKIHLALSTYLLSQWEAGALAGESADEAFFVRCDETNNPQRTRDLGQLIADVGVAPSIPLEFIVLRVGRVGHELEIEETGTGGR